MSISKIIGNNIRALMDKEHVSLRRLSESIGITHPTLIKYVEGKQPIDSEKLMLIALFFNKPFDDFFKENNDSLRFMFRADKPKKDVRNLDLNRLKNSIRSYLDVMDEIAFQYVPQKYKIDQQADSKVTFDLVAKIAYEQRRISNIENVIPNNYFEIIQNMGIHVIAKDFNNDAYFGASSFSNDLGSYIIINDSKRIPEERKIFSLIHEYGHLLFHSDQYSNSEFNAFYVNGQSDINERIANKFAGHFLMPRNMVDHYIESRKSIDPYEMKAYFKVSIQTVHVMLHEYQLISKDVYRQFMKDLTIHGNKTEEPLPLSKINFQDKNIRLITKIKDLYFKEEISANKISEVLGIDTLETRALLKEWRHQDERYLPLK
ncbi:MAG: XRE family transcriptional regulator [Acholeplasmataceae bacterium]|nr:XRE family transcriptional regulator [Acholeplasmataceae bacterium]